MKLPFLAWSSEYAVGHTELDAEHRRLVLTINEICSVAHAECAPNRLRPLLEALTIAAVEHFKHENMLMRELSYRVAHLQEDSRAIHAMMSTSAVNEHCAEHARALLELESIIHAYHFGADSDGEKLGKMLIDWFTEHALKHDADLRDGSLALRSHQLDFLS
jgi:hemerythrin